jgi:hypothetical protein
MGDTSVTEMTKAAEPQFIETTAGQITAELVRLGIAPDLVSRQTSM